MVLAECLSVREEGMYYEHYKGKGIADWFE